MGKRRHNAKARQVVKTSIDNSQTNEIVLDFATNEYGSTGASNLIALPSKKRHTKVVIEKKEKLRILSKAQRKRLQKIVDKKKKKENRAVLLESLSQVQASQDEVKQFTSISAVQTVGLKKLAALDLQAPTQVTTEVPQQKKISSIKGAKKRLRLLKLDKEGKSKKSKYDPSVVGLDDSSSCATISSDESDEVEEVVPEENSRVTEHEILNKNIKNDIPVEKNKSQIPVNNVINNAKSIDKKKMENKCLNTKKDMSKTTSNIEVKTPLRTLNHVEVQRDPKIQIERLKLPILGEEERIMETINENDIIIIAGETGSGKTTQIPQFLYEAGYAERRMIGITEPRRVAAVSMAKRVAYELSLSDKEVSYLIRFEGNVTKDTKIKFMTDGVLLKEFQSDVLLSKYKVLIIDEAHERSIFTDVLLGLLSKVVHARRKRNMPMKLIVMSATLRIQDFTENPRLFKTPPPVINVEGRQFPVTIHFNQHTYPNYVKEAYKKAVKIHTKLPDGGILIFVTGREEVNYLVRKLRAAFPYKKDSNSKLIQRKQPVTKTEADVDSEPDDIESDDDEVEKEMKRMLKARRKAKLNKKKLPKINLNDYGMSNGNEDDELLDTDQEMEEWSDSDTEVDTLAVNSCRQPMWVLPLYSMLSSAAQARVFAPPPPGARVCVVSTDVAETSLTIPAIKYVVDSGKKKMRLYDQMSGMSTWRVVWCSQASAEQRAGRAGRTGAGHAYRLYSSAVYQHDCPPHHPPEVCRRPLDELVLQMRTMGIDKVVNFPFPTAPDKMQLIAAEKRLEVLSLLEKPKKGVVQKRQTGEEILVVTPLGKEVAEYTVPPRYGKILALSKQRDLLPYTIALVSALSVPELMVWKPEKWATMGQMQLLGDPGVLLRAVGAGETAYSRGEGERFCAEYEIRDKSFIEVRKLRKQLTALINKIRGVDIMIDPEMKPPSENQTKLLRQLMLSGMGDHVARKIGLDEVKQGEDKRKFKYAYQVPDHEEPVYMHSDSILRKVIPNWVVYQELYETTNNQGKKKMVMRGVTAIEVEWLPMFVTPLCNLEEPLTDPEPSFDDESGRVKCHVKGLFGRAGWSLPVVMLDYPNNVDRYRWFGRFLVEGLVCPKLQKYRKLLLSPPSTMIKSWAKLQPRTELLLKALLQEGVGTKDQLLKVWEQQSHYLLDEYLSWLPVSSHNEIMLFWPPT